MMQKVTKVCVLDAREEVSSSNWEFIHFKPKHKPCEHH